MADERPQGTTNEDLGFPSLDMALSKVKRRKKKVAKAKRASEEITYVNIIALVDILTIILIFLLKSVSVSNTSVTVSGDMTLPFSTTHTNPVEAAKIFITHDKIVVETSVVAEIYNGAIDSKRVAENGYLIPGVQDALSNWIKWQILYRNVGKGNMNLQILADKNTPYHILMQVLYSATRAQAEKAGKQLFFDKYRLMVMRAPE
jgi:biopolymer transport protein ExbD